MSNKKSAKSKFFKICEKCKTKTYFISDRGLQISLRKNGTFCNSCLYFKNKQEILQSRKFIKQCKICEKEIVLARKGLMKNNICHKCSSIKNGEKTRFGTKRNPNPMNTKNIYKIWIDKHGTKEANKKIKKHKERLSVSIKKYKNSLTKEQLSKLSIPKNKNFKRKSVYEYQILKYGIKEANRKNKITAKKKSLKMKGENNPMFGKPAPKGSGIGWSGKYKGYNFRSLFELTYLIYLIENNLKFLNGESKKFRIQYELDGNKRNYYPDFYLEESKQIIELKPSQLLNTIQNKLKFKAAKEKYGNKFKIITEKDLKMLEPKDLLSIDKRKLKLNEKFKIKLQKLQTKDIK